MNHVKQHPSQDTLAEVRSYADTQEPSLPDGFVRMTDAELRDWIATEKANGWTPQRTDIITEVTNEQIRVWMLTNGMDPDSVPNIIDTLPIPPQEKAIAKVRWEYRTEIRRDSQLVQMVAAQLGRNVDQVFQEASRL